MLRFMSGNILQLHKASYTNSMLFWIYITVISVSAFLFSWLGCHLARILLQTLQVVDTPNARSNHTVPTPRGGGIAVTGTILVFMGITGVHPGILLAAFALAVLCFYDDRQPLPVLHRVVVQVLAIGVLFLPGGVVDTQFDGLVFQGIFPPLMDAVFTAIMLFGFMNVFNFMDGIDGITGVQTCAIGLGLAAIAMVGSGLKMLGVDGVILASAALGFLVLNWHPARLFLGDVGSIPIGFISGFLLLQLAAEGHATPALLLPAYYMVDGGLTFAKRALTGQKVWQAHSQHAYQKAVRQGFGHDWVSLRIAMLNYGLIVLACISVALPNLGDYALVLGYGLALGLFAYFHRLPRPANAAITAQA